MAVRQTFCHAQANEPNIGLLPKESTVAKSEMFAHFRQRRENKISGARAGVRARGFQTKPNWSPASDWSGSLNMAVFRDISYTNRTGKRGILIVVRDPGTGFPGQFPVAPLGKMFIPITAAEAI
jgi:hypothetical protein